MSMVCQIKVALIRSWYGHDIDHFSCYRMADALIVFLGICNTEHLAPVYLGDTVTDHCIITDVKIRDAYDIVTSEHILINQHGVEVLKVTKNSMYKKGVAQQNVEIRQTDKRMVSIIITPMRRCLVESWLTKVWIWLVQNLEMDA